MYATLKECPLFRGLTEEQIKNLFANSEDYTLSEYHDGDLIARRDTAYSGLMIILKGTVHGKMTYASGRSAEIEPIEAPQLIAPAFLFGGYNRLPIDVIADGDVTIMTIHRGFLFELMQANVVILSNFVDILSNRANVWSRKIYYLSFRSLQEKVASYLLEHIHANKTSLPMPDITMIASCFDATRSALRTVLDEMAKKRLIRCEEKSIEVLNPQGLRDILK